MFLKCKYKKIDQPDTKKLSYVLLHVLKKDFIQYG